MTLRYRYREPTPMRLHHRRWDGIVEAPGFHSAQEAKGRVRTTLPHLDLSDPIRRNS